MQLIYNNLRRKKSSMLAIDLKRILGSHTILWSYFDTKYLLHLHNLDSSYSISDAHVMRRVVYTDNPSSALEQVLITDVTLQIFKKCIENGANIRIVTTVSIEGHDISVSPSYVDTQDKALKRSIELELEEIDYQYYPLYEHAMLQSFTRLLNFDLHTKKFIQLNDIVDRSEFRNHLMIDYSLDEIVMDFLSSLRFKIAVKNDSADTKYELSVEFLHKHYTLNEDSILKQLHTRLNKVSFAGIDRYFVLREFYSLDDAILNGIELTRHATFKYDSKPSIKVKILSR